MHAVQLHALSLAVLWSCAAWSTRAPCLCRSLPLAEAGGLPEPTLLRTWGALKKTLVHLRGLMGRVAPEAAAAAPTAASSGSSDKEVSLLEAHRFLWDRYRSIRKDITQTELAHKVRRWGSRAEQLMPLTDVRACLPLQPGGA